MAYSIAVWNWTPDTWNGESGLSSVNLMLLQDSANKVISRDVNGWVDTLATVVNNTTFSTHGFSLGDISGLTSVDWQSLYTNFTPPLKFCVFKEEDAISQNKLKSTCSQNDYTVARSYEVEISESDLQKVKSLSVV